MRKYTPGMFTAAELIEIREKFYYVDKDCYGRERLFLDNAGGSLRLKKAEEAFHRIDSMPDASEHSNSLALELAALEDRGREDIKKVIFNAKSGAIYPSYTASQIAMDKVKTKMVDGRMCLVIPVDGGVEVNGVPVYTENRAVEAGDALD